MSDETLSYVRIATVIISFTYALWQYWQRRKVEKFIAHKAMELHRTIGMALGAAQAALGAIANNTSPIAEVGRTEGLTQAALIESVDLYCNLRKTTLDEIEEMVVNQQIIAHHQPIFNTFSNRRKGFIRKVIKCILNAY